ncbi:MAG: hypothetical protein ACR2RL_09065 [Gammaproteobacteria bacterium]
MKLAMNRRRASTLTLVGMLAGLAAGCAANRVDHDNAQRLAMRSAAEAGDVQAQFLLAEAYCCGAGFYSTEEAVKWWCRAAAAGHQGAMKRLDEVATGGQESSCARPSY